MTTPKADCHFKPSAQAAWICARYIFPDPGRRTCQFEPFCSWDDGPCPTNGLQHKPRANYQPGDDGEID